jgi:hypothetical protein
MADLAAIREGLATNLRTLPEATMPERRVYAYLKGRPVPPCAEVEPGPTTYDLAMGRGLDQLQLKVRVFIGLDTDEHAQKTLDRMLATTGPDSVKTAIEADRTLGGAASDARVTGASGYLTFGTDERARVIGAEWTVEVLTSH